MPDRFDASRVIRALRHWWVALPLDFVPVPVKRLLIHHNSTQCIANGLVVEIVSGPYTSHLKDCHAESRNICHATPTSQHSDLRALNDVRIMAYGSAADFDFEHDTLKY